MSKKNVPREELIAAAKEKFIAHEIRHRFGLGGGDWTDHIDVWQYLSTRPEKGKYEKIALDQYLKLWHKVGKHLFTEEEKADFESLVAVRYLLTVPSHPIRGESKRNLDFFQFLRFGQSTRVYDCGEAGYLVKYYDVTQEKFILLQGKNTHLQPGDFVRHFAKYFAEGRDDLYEMKGGVDFIFQRLGEAVGETIASAKKTFAEACAVSLDGHSVTVADKVYLVGEKGVKICNASLFLQDKDKIQRPLTYFRMENKKSEDIEHAIRLVRSNSLGAVFMEASEHCDERIFIVAPNHVAPQLLEQLTS